MKTPIYLPYLQDKDNHNKHIIAADVGGTKTNIAYFKINQQNLELLVEDTYSSTEYASFNLILQDFILKSGQDKAHRICIGVAGPVINQSCTLTNLSWVMDAAHIKKEFGFENVSIINDLEATAYGLHNIEEGYIATLVAGDTNAVGNVALIAPGTGLGEAGLYYDGSYLRPFATEGGHTEFSPRTTLEIELLQYLQKKETYISWESLLSGPGLHSIYLFLKEEKKHEEPAWLTQRFEEDDPSAVINHSALRGLSATCSMAMQLFVQFLAREASHLVLKMKATGGLYLGGGIPPKIFSFLNQPEFHHYFIQNEKMEDLLKNIPIHVILNSKTALYGAGYYGAFATK